MKSKHASKHLTGSVSSHLGTTYCRSPCSSSKVRTGGDTNRRWLLGWKKNQQTIGFLPFSPLAPRGENFPCAALTHSGFCRPRRPLYLSPPAPAAGLEEPQPEWVTGFSSPLPLYSHPLPHTCLLEQRCRLLEGVRTWKFSGPGQVRDTTTVLFFCLCFLYC